MKHLWKVLVVMAVMLVLVVIPAITLASNGGVVSSKAPTLEKIIFIHWWKGNVSRSDIARVPKPPLCYKFLTPTKIKWNQLPVNYVINPTNAPYLSENLICSTVTNSGETWDGVTGKELFTDYTACLIDYTATYGVQNYKNAIVFGNYPTIGVIAVTTVWYNPATKSIVEFYIMFDTDWRWGDAEATPTVDSNDSTAVMDLQNIAIHELGHGVGLADVYESACSVVTMYGYSNYEETQKRTLELSDIIGLQTLYGK